MNDDVPPKLDLLCRRHRKYEAMFDSDFEAMGRRSFCIFAGVRMGRLLSMVNDHTHTDFKEADLIADLKGRNREAMGALYDRYGRALYGIAFRIVRSEQGAEDVVQEALIRIWGQIDRFDPTRGTLFTWMHSIVRNLSLDMVKSRGYRNTQENRSLDDVVDTVEKENTISYNPEIIGLKESVDALEPELALIVDTLYYKGYTQSEAAEELALPIGTIKTRARRALNRLRGMMGGTE